MNRIGLPFSRHLSPKIWRRRIERLSVARREAVRGYEYRQIIELRGEEFANAATRHARQYYDPNVRISYDRDRGCYLASTEPKYSFSATPRLQYFLNGLTYRGEMLFREYLLENVPFEDGDHIVECGGNDGDFSLALGLAGRRFLLDTFEPSPREYNTLSCNISEMKFYDDATAHRFALWDASGQHLDFYVKSGTADSSIHLIQEFDEVVKVETRRLDEVLPRKRYKLLKLEAEGAEPEILAGALGILDCFDYITADVGFERGVAQESTLPEVANFLQRNGFKILRLGRPRTVVLFCNERVQ